MFCLFCSLCSSIQSVEKATSTGIELPISPQQQQGRDGESSHEEDDIASDDESDDEHDKVDTPQFTSTLLPFESQGFDLEDQLDDDVTAADVSALALSSEQRFTCTCTV